MMFFALEENVLPLRPPPPPPCLNASPNSSVRENRLWDGLINLLMRQEKGEKFCYI